MNMLELLEAHPKAAIVVKQWLLDKMLTSMKVDSVPDDFKEFVKQQGIDNDKVAKIIEGMPRSLFDVFDEHKVYVSTSVDTSLPQAIFTWTIDGEGDNDSYSTRKDCDTNAIIHAFKLLEAKL